MSLFYGLMAGLMFFAVFTMWRRRHGVVDRRVEPNFDQSEGQPEVAEALALLQAKDWTTLARLYHRLPPSDRYHLVNCLGRMAGAPPDIPATYDSALLTIAGGMRLVHATTLQGHGPAYSVVRANWERMTAGSKAAQETLLRAHEADPHDTACLAFQMLLESGPVGLGHLVRRTRESGEHNIYAGLNHMLMQSHTPAFSSEDMWRAANDWATDAPNAAWLALPARAYIEDWSNAMNGGAPNAGAARNSMIALMQDDGFLEHLAGLDRSFWQDYPRASLTGAEASFAHNHFAFLMHVFRIKDRARPHLERIGPHISRAPWSYLPTGLTHPTRLLAEMRREYGLPALPQPRPAPKRA